MDKSPKKAREMIVSNFRTSWQHLASRKARSSMERSGSTPNILHSLCARQITFILINGLFPGGLLCSSCCFPCSTLEEVLKRSQIHPSLFNNNIQVLGRHSNIKPVQILNQCLLSILWTNIRGLQPPSAHAVPEYYILFLPLGLMYIAEPCARSLCRFCIGSVTCCCANIHSSIIHT